MKDDVVRKQLVLDALGQKPEPGKLHLAQDPPCVERQVQATQERQPDAKDRNPRRCGILRTVSADKLELLQQKLEDFLLFFSNQSAGPQSSSADPHGRTHLGEIDQARDELLWLALRKVDVVVRERTVLEAVIGFTRTGAIELEDGLEDLVSDPLRASSSDTVPAP